MVVIMSCGIKKNGSILPCKEYRLNLEKAPTYKFFRKVVG